MTFTFKEVESALNLAVDTKGEDYVYELPEPATCAYSMPGPGEPQPSCIVGHVIHTLDPEAFKLIASREWKGERFMHSSSVGAIENTFEVELWDPQQKEKIVNFLGYAQNRQDMGRNWGSAREAAYAAIGEH